MRRVVVVALGISPIEGEQLQMIKEKSPSDTIRPSSSSVTKGDSSPYTSGPSELSSQIIIIPTNSSSTNSRCSQQNVNYMSDSNNNNMSLGLPPNQKNVPRRQQLLLLAGPVLFTSISSLNGSVVSTVPLVAFFRCFLNEDNQIVEMELENLSNSTVLWKCFSTQIQISRLTSTSLIVTPKHNLQSSTSVLSDNNNIIHPISLTFNTEEELEKVQNLLSKSVYPASEANALLNNKKILHDDCHLKTTDPTTVQTYFQYYGKMVNQMNMLQDTVRTELYRQAIFSNPSNFNKARVMDVGAGSGILSFFSAQAGAELVYAVEASTMASTISSLASTNPTPGARIKVINKTIEGLSLKEDLEDRKVDVLVSEPIGTFLLNERMIETYLYARDLFLKPGGKMFPNKCRLFLAPFSDSQLHSDISSRCAFWSNTDFYGLNLSHVFDRAVEEQIRQPVVDYIHPNSIVCPTWHTEEFDLETIDRKSLSQMEFKFCFPITSPCLIHGIAGWFDVLFEGSDTHVGFSTAPWCSPTHWYQIRFLFKQPIAANPGQFIKGTLRMIGNEQQSYYITINSLLEGTNITTESALIDLKDPDYRYYSNPQASYVPNTTNTAAPQTMNKRTTSDGTQ